MTANNTPDVVTHAGGWKATEQEVAAVPVPVATRTHAPIPHAEMIQAIRGAMPDHGITERSLRLTLARDGNQVFGIFGVTAQKWNGRDDVEAAIGFRSSYDSTLAANLTAGTHVFVCDNMAFSGEFMANRKHTYYARRDLPLVVSKLMRRVAQYQSNVVNEIEAMEKFEMNQALADHVIMEAMRRKVALPSSLREIDREWREPEHKEFMPRNAWSLYNAFTAAERESGQMVFRRTLGLTSLFRSYVPRMAEVQAEYEGRSRMAVR